MKPGLLAGTGGAPAFNPLTDMTNLVLWGSAPDSTNNGTIFTAIPNLADAGASTFNAHITDRPLVSPSPINSMATFRLDQQGAASYGMKWSGGRLLSDDIYDFYAVVKIAAQNNKTLFSQHPGGTPSGRITWGTGSTSTDKARTFFNNGTSYSGESTDVAFDNTARVVRFYSAGSGDHYIQVDDGTPTLVVTGQQVTPNNVFFAIGSLSTAILSNPIDPGDLGEFLCCTSVQANSADVVTYLKTRWGIS
jgi:hypothetical protein